MKKITIFLLICFWVNIACFAEDYDYSSSFQASVSTAIQNMGVNTAMQVYNSMNSFKSSMNSMNRYSAPSGMFQQPRFPSQLTTFNFKQQEKLNAMNEKLSREYSQKLNEINDRNYLKNNTQSIKNIDLNTPKLDIGNQPAAPALNSVHRQENTK